MLPAFRAVDRPLFRQSHLFFCGDVGSLVRCFLAGLNIPMCLSRSDHFKLSVEEMHDAFK